MNKLILLILASAFAHARMNPLEMAIAVCNVGNATKLLNEKSDPNALDERGKPILTWFASAHACHDDSALATAKLLVSHGAKFGPEILNSVAFRKMPDTLRFFAKKKLGDPSQALRSIAQKDDIESIRVLLEAGADPLSGSGGMTSSLFDASAKGREDSVAEMLKHVKEKNSPKVIAAYQVADKRGEQKITKLFTDVGVKPPPKPTQIKPRCPRQELSVDQSQLLAKLGITDHQCKFVQACGDLMLIDCYVAADGPAYYVDQKTIKVEATCGGACMGGRCTNCPPKAWTCDCAL
jgi:hypothetical protein